MNYGAIKKNDIADGPGVRVSLFVSGCSHHCKGCFQPETWDYDFGSVFDEQAEQEIIDAMKPSWIKGITILGGEPFEPVNQRVLVPFLKKLKVLYPSKNIWVYSGYLFDELNDSIAGTGRARCEVTDEFISMVDVLVDGKYILEKRNLMLKFRGSDNQRLICVKESLETNSIVLWDD